VRYVFIAAWVAAITGAQPKTATLEKGFTLTADYLVRSLPTETGTLVTNDYLVVEVKFAGPFKIKTSSDQFLLRINGQKLPIMTESAGTVAASLKYPDWTQKPTVTGSVGNGNADVIIGPRAPVEHFPGDPSVRPTQLPRVPEPENPTGEEKAPPMSIDEKILRATLPEGEAPMPVAGLLYFPFQKKTKSIKSVELLYDGPVGKATLKLQ